MPLTPRDHAALAINAIQAFAASVDLGNALTSRLCCLLQDEKCTDSDPEWNAFIDAATAYVEAAGHRNGAYDALPARGPRLKKS